MKTRRLMAIAILAMACNTVLADTAHVFSLDTSAWNDKPKRVAVAGSFNGWNKEAIPLHKKGNVWSASVTLPDGVHQYKFVIDNERWISDPNGDAAFNVDDTFGGHNSGVLIGPDARKLPAPKPNQIEPKGIKFDPKDQADLNIIDGRSFRVRVRTQANDVEQVVVRFDDGQPRVTSGIGGPHFSVPLRKIGTQLGYDTFGGVASIPDWVSVEKPLTIRYFIELVDGTARSAIANGNDYAPAAADPVTGLPLNQAGKPYPSESFILKPTFVTPDWARDAVWYQIFPERFRNGDPANDPSPSAIETPIRWTSKWFDAQPNEAAGTENFYEGKGNVWKRRYGGDIQGIQQQLPYLKKLGITAIYLNPVFEAESMHKYDATDFRHIDDNFGVKGDWPVAGETDDPKTWKWSASDKVFLDFVAEAHKAGMKVIIDGVWNHVGRRHPYFRDVLEHGKNSRYASWFDIIDWGDPKHWHKMDDPFAVHGKPGGIQWKAWDGANGHLPAFAKNNEKGLADGPAEHIFAVTRRWLAPDGDPTRGVDGFRLDAPNEIPHPFWRRYRQVVKDAKPDAYITGEIWSPAQPWINDGQQYDAVMNYQFAMPAQAFFVNQKNAMKPSAFLSKLTEVVYMYPQQASLVMQNLFDSHDTDRLASMFVNPDLAYDNANRIQDNGPKYDGRKPNAVEWQRMLQAVACQMTYLGAPMIYYGDEAGMWSPDDPSNRQPMTWPDLTFDDPEVKFDATIFEQYRKLIEIRKASPALSRGDFFPVSSDDAAGTLVYGRRLGNETVYVVLNRSNTERSVATPKESATFVDAIADAKIASTDGQPSIRLKPYGYAILMPKKP